MADNYFMCDCDKEDKDGCKNCNNIECLCCINRGIYCYDCVVEIGYDREEE